MRGGGDGEESSFWILKSELAERVADLLQREKNIATNEIEKRRDPTAARGVEAPVGRRLWKREIIKS